MSGAAEGAALGRQMHGLIAELYPICRSITGDGFRRTLEVVGRDIPLETHEVPSGTRVLDWTVPPEWNIRDAYVKNAEGERVIDFRRSNLHIMSYSVPVHARMSKTELLPHLHSVPDQPDVIPYRTSYYSPAWGFCVSHRQLSALPEGDYEVVIDSSLSPGHLTFGECRLEGELPGEILISCHACHPSLCNDNLSGVVLAAFLARHLWRRARRHSFRFLFVPGTIGAITWLALNEAVVPLVKHGLVLTGVGDGGHLTYKKSRRGDADVDRAAVHVLARRGQPFSVEAFAPYGYDERQYCSPGFNMPVGCLMRSPWGRYPEYHTSADNLDFVRPAALADSFSVCADIIDLLERNRRYVNLSPKGEPQLGTRGLYDPIGGSPDSKAAQLAMLWVLNLSDGRHSLLDIAERSGTSFDAIAQAADTLRRHDLLVEAGAEGV